MTAIRLILGTAQLAMPYGIAGNTNAASREDAFELLAAAADLGLAGLDTAPEYADAELWIGIFLHRRRTQLEITSKLPAVPDGIGAREIRQYVEHAVTRSLRQLQIEHIDRYLLHRADDLRTHGEALTDALAEQAEAGRIIRFGLSAYSPEDALLLDSHPQMTVLQHPMSLLDRRLPGHPVFAKLRKRKVSIEARSVLLQGLLTLDPGDPRAAQIGATEALGQLRKTLAGFEAEPADIAVAFALHTGADRVLIGVENAAQLQAHMIAAARKLPDGLVEAVAALPAAGPFVDPRTWPEPASNS